MRNWKSLTFVLALNLIFVGDATSQQFTREDTLRGSITPERAWWDLVYYHLDIEVDPDDRFIEGSNTFRYEVLHSAQVLQVDLQDPLNITSAVQDGESLEFLREGDAYFIQLKKNQIPGKIEDLIISYEGNPHTATRPPWSGGITWSRDSNGNHFVASSCQGIGASIWWPCKDHMYDEVDSMLMSVTVPEDLINVSNGRLRKTTDNGDQTVTYEWFVGSPINNYCVNINIGDYVHFGEVFPGESGDLDMDYYVLRENLEKAKSQFVQSPMMMKAFEHWFGPYPFYDDSFKLVEVPYLGMEHQSSITYGNKYQNGYLGRDLSDTGWGLKFDFIIIHEAGHEWFANNITYKDRADMWIHEGFTAYSESLYLEYHFGKEAGADYVTGTRSHISNDRPIIAPYDVNAAGSGDMYSKGSNMLHTLRQVVNNDEKWRQVLRQLNKEFYHQTVTTAQIESFMSNFLGLDLDSFFTQYLRDARIPILEYRIKDTSISFKWTNVVSGFDMPVEIVLDGSTKRIQPTGHWKSISIDRAPETFQIDRDYYVGGLNISGR